MVKYIYTCNVCGKRISKEEEEDRPNIYYYGRYAFHDGEKVEIDFCFDCFDKLINSCKINPVGDINDWGAYEEAFDDEDLKNEENET